MDDLLLYGPPGTGKTTTGIRWLGDRVEHDGADVRAAAFVSFTNAAVDVARGRLSERFDLDPDDLPYSRTIHSLCKRCLGITDRQWLADEQLSAFAESCGYDLRPSRKRGEEDDLEHVLEKQGSDAVYLTIWDFCRHRLITDPEAGWREFMDYHPDAAAYAMQGRFGYVVEDYERWKQANGLRDYTDLLLEYCDDPLHLPVSVAVVDECQDLSPLLWKAADLLFRDADFRATLGDDDQAIYSYSGADPALMNSRPYRKKVKLVQSHRLPRQVAEAALSIIDQNDNREPKLLRPRDAEGEATRACFLEELALLNGESWFVLVRNWRLLDQVLPVLEEEGIPYRLGGRRYSPWSDRGPLRAVRTILRLAAGQPVTMGDLWPLVQKTNTARGDKPGVWAFGSKKRLEEAAATEPDRLLTWRDLLSLGMTAWGFQRVMKRDLSVLTREVSQRDLFAYENALKRNTLMREVQVDVSSIHGRKGQEAENVVALMACTAGPARSMMRPWRAEEERRVAYVAATRARQRFYGLLAQPAEGVFTYEVFGV